MQQNKLGYILEHVNNIGGIPLSTIHLELILNSKQNHQWKSKFLQILCMLVKNWLYFNIKAIILKQQEYNSTLKINTNL